MLERTAVAVFMHPRVSVAGGSIIEEVGCKMAPINVTADHKLNSKTVAVLPSFDPILIFPFHLFPSPVHFTGFSFCFCFPVLFSWLLCYFYLVIEQQQLFEFL